MVIKIPLILILFAYAMPAACQADTAFNETGMTLHTKTGEIHGTLITPHNFTKGPVALLIAGSGPTDGDGNNPVMKNDGLKKTAQALAASGICSLRFDKRGIAKSQASGIREDDLRFEHYVNDAKEWVGLLKKDQRFTTLTIIGHSEGSLIGMLAAQQADRYISVAGPGQSADKLIKEQLAAQPKQVQDATFPMIDSLKNGMLVKQVSPMLYALFRPSVQPYLISWFRYDPQVEIQKLKIPILIIQGTNDIQVSVEDANRLHQANSASKLVLIKDMNHVFREVPGDRTENLKTYNDPALPLSPEFVNSIVRFIKQL